MATDICLQDNTVDEEIAFLNFDSNLLFKDTTLHCFNTEGEIFDALVAFVRR